MSWSRKFSIAFTAYKTAHKFIKQHKLWHFVLIPGVVNLVFFVAFLYWVMGSVGGWVDALFEWQCVDEDSSVYWLCETFSLALSGVKLLFGWLIKSVFIMVYLAIYKNIILFLYSPVIAYLVEVVEQKDKGIEAPFIMEQFIKDTVRGIVIALRNLLLEGACVIALLVMAVVPVVNLFQPILLWLVSAYFLGFSMMDYSLERKRLNARSSVDYIKKHKSLATGIGAVFQLMYLVPFVGWMFAPTYSAVAAYFAVEELEKMNE